MSRLVLAFAVAGLTSGARASIEVNVTFVGFPFVGRDSGGQLVRTGTWTPIVVDLALVGQPAFDGTLRVGQFDDDGDEAVDAVEVHLRAESGGTQRARLYVPANTVRNGGRFPVELRTAEGEVVPVLCQGEIARKAEPAFEPTIIGHDVFVILYVSTGALGRVAEVVNAELGQGFTQEVYLAHLSPEDMPESWVGLEAIDAVIWEDVLPEAMTRNQLAALLQWVRQGGSLLLTASRTAGSLKLSDLLSPLIPAALGEVTAVRNLPEVRRTLLEPPISTGDVVTSTDEWWQRPFPQPAPIVRATAYEDARVVARDPFLDTDVIVRRREGRGHVLFSAVTLRDLFSGEGRVAPLFRHLFYLVKTSGTEVLRLDVQSPYDHVAAAVGFSTSGSAYLFLAALFSIGYVVAATFGTWTFLGARGWRKHSWTAFAVVGALASFASAVAVGSVRGIGDRLHQVSVIDVDATDRSASATVWFGLKTGIDKVLDVWMPTDWVAAREPMAGPNVLRPLPAGRERVEAAGSFTDPSEYRVHPSTAVVENLRVRGTLKRLEGRWQGRLEGTMEGLIEVRGTWITEDSFLRNRLGVDLYNCILFHPGIDPGATASYRDNGIYVHAVGDLPADGVRVPLAARCYGTALGDSPGERPARPVLVDVQRQWSRPFRAAMPDLRKDRGGALSYEFDLAHNALLLASTAGEFDPTRHSAAIDQWSFGGHWFCSRDRLRHLDLRAQLQAGRGGAADSRREPGSAVLIGFSRDPGPVRLFTRSGDRPFHVLHPEEEYSWSMYRIVMPIQRLDLEPAPDDPLREDGSTE